MRKAMILLLFCAYWAALAQRYTTDVYSSAKRPRALALIGDRYHSPVYIRHGLASVLVRENIPVTFIESPAALAAHRLLIILRNGADWPNG